MSESARMPEAPREERNGAPSARLRMDSIVRHFRQARTTVRVLEGVSLSVGPGELVALVGASGSGKSTLLHLAGLLDRADGGRLFLDGRDVTRSSERARTLLRRRALGFVYQYHYLLSDFSAEENLMVAQRINGVAAAVSRARARALLESVGLGSRCTHRPAGLSGGEQQRVALCRAIINGPRLVLADEPTGNLDPRAADEAFDLLLRLVRDSGASALVATHNFRLARRMDRVLRLSAGAAVEEPGAALGLEDASGGAMTAGFAS